MEEISSLLREVLNIDFVRAVISNPEKKEGIIKVKVRPVETKGNLHFQIESFTKTQAFHENLSGEEAAEKILKYMEDFRQMQIETVHEDCTVLVSRKGKVTVKRRKRQTAAKKADLSHNRKKQYILEEGIPVPFLQDLGVMTADGKIVRSKTDKFRQINRFLEFIEDILPRLDSGRELTIIDFGCEKSYLTFAMYYYLHELKGYNIRITGLDLKKDVILSVPCCQHELNRQIKNESMAPVMDYGLLKERFAAIVTDGLRAKYLEREGYDAQILEFIDMEHTPKNILIRAVKKGKRNEKITEEIIKCEELLGVKPILGVLLDD